MGHKDNHPEGRVRWRYPAPVEVPPIYQKFLWDHPEQVAPLEKFILRILTYGKFEDIRWLYNKYPEETKDIVRRYKEIKRGIRFWIKYWENNGITLS